jgi:hypothetical protein
MNSDEDGIKSVARKTGQGKQDRMLNDKLYGYVCP